MDSRGGFSPGHSVLLSFEPELGPQPGVAPSMTPSSAPFDSLVSWPVLGPSPDPIAGCWPG
eukprot:scaffold11665_cov48-Cyclotella_meneghiniana.AAC.4